MEYICQYNKMIDCDPTMKCQSCGWNPAVSAKRVNNFIMKRRQDEESNRTYKYSAPYLSMCKT